MESGSGGGHKECHSEEISQAVIKRVNTTVRSITVTLSFSPVRQGTKAGFHLIACLSSALSLLLPPGSASEPGDANVTAITS